jgi:hypothetical protein
MNTNFNNDIDGALSLIVVNGKTYQLGKDASASVGGIAKLYAETGENTDGSMTQAAISAAIASAAGDASDVASDLSAYQTSNDAAVQAVAGDVDALETLIGNVTSGKTVVEMISDAQAAATYDDTALAARVSANEGDLTTLKAGATTQGSVAYQIAQIVNENNNGSIDTLNEIAAWIVSDTTGAAKMAGDISSLSSGKADKVASAVSGNFAGLDANGNLTDSGSKASDFKTVQSAVSDPTASGNGISFIDSISQNANGVISATKKTVQSASASQAGLMSAADYSKLAAVSATVSGDTLTLVTAVPAA